MGDAVSLNIFDSDLPNDEQRLGVNLYSRFGGARALAAALEALAGDGWEALLADDDSDFIGAAAAAMFRDFEGGGILPILIDAEDMSKNVSGYISDARYPTVTIDIHRRKIIQTFRSFNQRGAPAPKEHDLTRENLKSIADGIRALR